MKRRRFLALLGGSGFAAVAGALGWRAASSPTDPTPTPPAQGQPPPTSTGTPTATPGTPSTPAPSPEPTPEPTVAPGVPDPDDDPDLVMVVDKERALPDGYVPPQLEGIDPGWMVAGFEGQLFRGDVFPAVEAMMTAAQADGFTILIRSAYRSYETQQETFAHWVEVHGEEEARRRSAPPGHSEHQLGTTIDFSSESVGWELSQDFGQVDEGRWLNDHAHHFGFALSYPEGAEAITGYIYEPWHWRYIGRSAAVAWKQSGLTLVEFLEQRGA